MQRHILDMMRLLGGGPGKTLDLPGSLTFATDYGKALIGSADAVECYALDAADASRANMPSPCRVTLRPVCGLYMPQFNTTVMAPLSRMPTGKKAAAEVVIRASPPPAMRWIWTV